MSYLLSIVIPTRNRQYYLEYAVKQILGATTDEVQIVVQDNSDDNTLEEKLKRCPERVKYRYTAHRLSPMNNYNVGISLAEGEYVCCIGDDDGVMPQILDIVKWAKKNGIQSVNQSYFAQYWWPGANKSTAEFNDGVLQCAAPSCKIIVVDPKRELVKLLKDPRLLFTSVQMAKVYYGIISKDVLDEVKKRTGVYCGGSSTDIYLSTSTTLLVDKTYVIDFPFTLSGVCNKSTSCLSSGGNHVGKYEMSPLLVSSENYCWSDYVVRFFSVETVWAESMIHAISDMRQTQYLRYYSKPRQTTCTLWRHPEYIQHIIEEYKNEKGNIIRLGTAFIELVIRSLCARLKKRQKSTVNTSRDIFQHGVDTVVSAQQLLTGSFVENNVDNQMKETLAQYFSN